MEARIDLYDNVLGICAIDLPKHNLCFLLLLVATLVISPCILHGVPAKTEKVNQSA
jgi:hypothetical protein